MSRNVLIPQQQFDFEEQKYITFLERLLIDAIFLFKDKVIFGPGITLMTCHFCN